MRSERHSRIDFGGKSRIAAEVWRRFGGDVRNYIERCSGHWQFLGGVCLYVEMGTKRFMMKSGESKPHQSIE